MEITREDAAGKTKSQYAFLALERRRSFKSAFGFGNTPSAPGYVSSGSKGPDYFIVNFGERCPIVGGGVIRRRFAFFNSVYEGNARKMGEF
ncbi:MAG: hypothetical protein CR984_01305 [Proteobacteria bacterium]|nr:MAG: hypothetical protein CR984_01305 [Pseudomonadota bacterium]